MRWLSGCGRSWLGVTGHSTNFGSLISVSHRFSCERVVAVAEPRTPHSTATAPPPQPHRHRNRTATAHPRTRQNSVRGNAGRCGRSWLGIAGNSIDQETVTSNPRPRECGAGHVARNCRTLHQLRNAHLRFSSVWLRTCRCNRRATNTPPQTAHPWTGIRPPSVEMRGSATSMARRNTTLRQTRTRPRCNPVRGRPMAVQQ